MKRYGWLICFCLAGALSAWGQWSGSGSNGSDGALNLNSSTPGVVNGVLVFDPVALKLDPDGDNVYHFTTINISGISVVFQANKMRNPGPVIFLASGAVTLQGGINFNGENGHPSDSNQSIRRPSVPGPGGFPGGSGAPGRRRGDGGDGSRWWQSAQRGRRLSSRVRDQRNSVLVQFSWRACNLWQ